MPLVFKDDQFGLLATGLPDCLHDHVPAVGGYDPILPSIIRPHGKLGQVAAPEVEILGYVLGSKRTDPTDHGGNGSEMLRAVSRPHVGSVSTHAIPGQVDSGGIDGKGFAEMPKEKIEVGDLPTSLAFFTLRTTGCLRGHDKGFDRGGLQRS